MIEKQKHENEESLIFDDRCERNIYQAYDPENNYLHKINEYLR